MAFSNSEAETILTSTDPYCQAAFLEAGDLRWEEFLTSVPHDFFHLPEYTQLEADYTPGNQARAFWGKCEDTEVLIPLIVRPIPAALSSGKQWFDLTSPYGYPCPLFKARSADPSQAEALFLELKRLAAEYNYISAFLRLHPLLNDFPIDFSGLGEIADLGRTIYVNLSLSSEDLLAQIRKDHRAGIRKLEKRGYQVVIDDWKYLPQFIAIYRETMQRVSAKDFYFFSDQYFEDLRDKLGNHFLLATVLSPEGEVAASSLFSVSCGIMQYFLSGTAAAHLKVAPAKILLRDMILWAKQQNLKYLHLGGGVGAAEDSLFKFKEGFSKATRDFACIWAVFDQDKYQSLCRKRFGQDMPQEFSFFPAYRQ